MCTSTCHRPCCVEPFDPTKPVRTRDGRPARIMCTDAKSLYPIKALVETYPGSETVYSYNAHGRSVASTGSPHDLVNTPERVVRYVNIKASDTPLKGENYARAFSRDKDVPCDGAGYSTVKLTFEAGKLVGSEVIR
jgi:hypothetical protein